MKVSELTTSDIVEYLKLNDGEYTEAEIQMYLSASVSYVKAYTGLDESVLDDHEDITIAVMILCQDMYDNRSMYADKANPNKVIETILGMHSTNLLPTPD